MAANHVEDLRAVAFGLGLALLVYYGYAAVQVAAGVTSLDRPITWLGLAGGVALLGWVTRAAPRAGA